jgi:hypothetical protein
LNEATAADGSVVLVSGAHDGTVRVWHPASGELLSTLPIGVEVHQLLVMPANGSSHRRTEGGVTIVAGLRTGVGALDLNGHCSANRRSRAARSSGRTPSWNTKCNRQTPSAPTRSTGRTTPPLG